MCAVLTKLTVPCGRCGKPRPTWPHELQAKEDGRIAGLYCSRECSAADRRTSQADTAYCDHCGRLILTQPNRVRAQADGVHKLYCNPSCKALAQRRKVDKPLSLWARFLLREVQRLGSITALARHTGIERKTLSRYIRDDRRPNGDIRHPSENNYQRLHAVYGDELPTVEVFNSEARREMFLAGAAKKRETFKSPVRLEQAQTARKRKAEQMKGIPKGQKRPREVVEKLKATMRTSPKVQARIEELRKYHKTLKHQIERALTTWLRYHPTSDTDPDWSEALAELRKDVATRHGLPEKAIDAIWTPLLQKRGLKGKGGRPVEEHRFELLAGLAASKGISLRDRKPAGFWAEAGPLLFGPEVDSAETARNWWLRNKDRYPIKS